MERTLLLPDGELVEEHLLLKPGVWQQRAAE
jgi:hypothetical protein